MPTLALRSEGGLPFHLNATTLGQVSDQGDLHSIFAQCSTPKKTWLRRSFFWSALCFTKETGFYWLKDFDSVVDFFPSAWDARALDCACQDLALGGSVPDGVPSSLDASTYATEVFSVLRSSNYRLNYGGPVVLAYQRPSGTYCYINALDGSSEHLLVTLKDGVKLPDPAGWRGENPRPIDAESFDDYAAGCYRMHVQPVQSLVRTMRPFAVDFDLASPLNTELEHKFELIKFNDETTPKGVES